jgi:hypothetical protein
MGAETRASRPLPEAHLDRGELPPAYVVRSAIEVARQVDAGGAPVLAARHNYTRQASGGVYPPADMQRGECLLIEAGLLHDEDGTFRSSEALAAIVAVEESVACEALLAHCMHREPPAWLLELPIQVPEPDRSALRELLPDPARREAFLISLGRVHDATQREALGVLGEEHVAAVARGELEALGRDDLASAVRRVSLVSDQLGYDVVAPRMSGDSRRLEVKTAGRTLDGLAHFYLSRNEAEVGRRDPQWALVYCERVSERTELVGWCGGPALEPYLPTDAEGGRWRVAEMSLPLPTLSVGLPPAI